MTALACLTPRDVIALRRVVSQFEGQTTNWTCGAAIRRLLREVQ
jgi:hypothetical protein